MRNDKILHNSNHPVFYAVIPKTDVDNLGLTTLYLANPACTSCYEINLNRLRTLLKHNQLNYYTMPDGTQFIAERVYKNYFTTIIPYIEAVNIINKI